MEYNLDQEAKSLNILIHLTRIEILPSSEFIDFKSFQQTSVISTTPEAGIITVEHLKEIYIFSKFQGYFDMRNNTKIWKLFHWTLE